MRRFLNIVLVIQVLLGSFWTLTIASTAGKGDFGLLPLFLLVYIVLILGMLAGIWAFWRHPQLRRRAAWVIAMPVVFWFLPSIIKTLAGGHLSQAELAGTLIVVVAVALLACFIAPRRAASLLPGFLFRSRVFNSLLVLGVLGGWLVLIGLIAWIANDDSGSQSDTGYVLAYAIILGAFYLIWLGVGSLFAASWGWVGLRGKIENSCRKLHIAQLVVATPGILTGAAALAWLIAQR